MKKLSTIIFCRLVDNSSSIYRHASIQCTQSTTYFDFICYGKFSVLSVPTDILVQLMNYIIN